MSSSEARNTANRQNAQRSTGPKTIEGKERSRRNGLKHGMTGQGIVIPEDDLAEVERRDEALRTELAPKSVLGSILVGQMATLSIRMERGAKQEFATVASRVRNAPDEFDQERIALANELLKAISDDPRENLRKLLKSPEGVDVLVEAWQDLRADLTCESRPSWSSANLLTMANLLGLRVGDALAVRIENLTRATMGDLVSEAASDGGDLDRGARKVWARALLVERIDQEIAGLESHYETLDFATIEQDRAEAGARALFDPSKEASLARRYESEARRGFFKALKEFRQAEAEAAELAISEPASANHSSTETYGSLASSRDHAQTIHRGTRPESPRPSKPFSTIISREFEVGPGTKWSDSTAGQPSQGAA